MSAFLAFLGGLVIVSLTLRDVFYTVVVPGESRGPLRIVRRFTFVVLRVNRHIRPDGCQLAVSHAPLILVVSFITWMMSLILGFGLITFAFGAWFQPVIDSFSQAVYVAGSGVVTIGLSETDATGPARWIALAAGFCGLAVMTLAVTYLLEVQASVAQRDAGIVRLDTSAGNPPCALGLLTRYATLNARDEVRRVLHDGRMWCAAVLQSHSAHPSLIYFRSIAIGAGWPAALGALLDAAVIVEVLIDDKKAYATAVLLREEGTRMAKVLSSLVDLQPQAPLTSSLEIDRVTADLLTLGYPVSDDVSHQRFIALRNEYRPYVAALAHHLQGVEAPLITPLP